VKSRTNRRMPAQIRSIPRDHAAMRSMRPTARVRRRWPQRSASRPSLIKVARWARCSADGAMIPSRDRAIVAWAKASWQHSIWAEAFYRQREAKGHGFNTIMRALADKGIRIRWRCGQDDVAYDEMKYLKSLRTKGSTLGPEGLEL